VRDDLGKTSAIGFESDNDPPRGFSRKLWQALTEDALGAEAVLAVEAARAQV
jgi:hypothetical protein